MISSSAVHKIQTLMVKRVQRFKGQLRSVNANTELKLRKITVKLAHTEILLAPWSLSLSLSLSLSCTHTHTHTHGILNAGVDQTTSVWTRYTDADPHPHHEVMTTTTTKPLVLHVARSHFPQATMLHKSHL